MEHFVSPALKGRFMSFILHSWQLYVLVLAGWISRQQQDVIECLRTEKQVLKEKLGKKRILLNDDQRRRSAVKGKILGRKTEYYGTTFVRQHSQPAHAYRTGPVVCGSGQIHWHPARSSKS